MSQAKVTSVDALEKMRASVIFYLAQSHRALDEIADEVRRTRMWIQHDRRTFWEHELRRRQKVLDQAQQELMSAKMVRLQDNLVAKQAAVRKAKEALGESEEKLRNVKKWTRDFDSAVEPLLKRLENLREYLVHDMPRGIAFLAQAQKTLEEYSEVHAPNAAPAPAEKQMGESEAALSNSQNDVA